MEMIQDMFVQICFTRKYLLFVGCHRARIGVEKAKYDSSQFGVFLLVSICIPKLIPTSSAGSLSSNANMNENPEKGLKVMDGVMEVTRSIMEVTSTWQNFSAGIWRCPLGVS